MKKIFITVALMIPLVLALSGCLLEDREVEVVLNEETCELFPEDHGSENYTNTAVLELGAELDSLLTENEVSRDNIVDAVLNSGSYQILEFSHDHDWTINGSIMVQRTDITSSPVLLIEYDSVSLESELGVKTDVVLNSAGVAMVDAAMDDFIAGANPVLELSVVSGDVIPDPSVSDRLVFRWKACLNIQVIFMLDTEVFNGVGGS